MKRVLICEDEPDIRDFVAINLQRAGYDVAGVSSGEEAVAAFDGGQGKTPFDIYLLDIMLPGGIDGVTVCKHIRSRSAGAGIIMLTAKAQEMDKVQCLMLGADDYVTKPFSPSELVARVDALCRRAGAVPVNADVSANSSPFAVNRKARTIAKNGAALDLTPVEYHILEYFLASNGAALDRRSILRHIWGEKYFGDEKIVDVNVRRLRMKIEDDPGNPAFIQTVWGVGYKWFDGQ